MARTGISLKCIFRDKACWILFFFFGNHFPASEDNCLELGLSKSSFRKISENGRRIEYRGVADKRVIRIGATRPGPRDGMGFCQTMDIELIETLD